MRGLHRQPRALKPGHERLRGVYAIIDNSGRPELDHLALARAAVRAGVKAVQLRAKDLPTRDLVAAAQEIARLCRSQGVLFIVNDRLDAALAAGADGVHLGQDDLPLDAARRIAGNRLLIGVSTHSAEEARQAERQGADYVGFGAMYATTGKAKVTAPQGVERLAEACRAVAIPVIAIGGITREKIPEIHAAEAGGAAVIGAWVLAAEPETALRSLVQAWQALD